MSLLLSPENYSNPEKFQSDLHSFKVLNESNPAQKIIANDDSSISTVGLFRFYWEKLKGMCGFVDHTETRYIERQFIAIVMHGVSNNWIAADQLNDIHEIAAHRFHVPSIEQDQLISLIKNISLHLSPSVQKSAPPLREKVEEPASSPQVEVHPPVDQPVQQVDSREKPIQEHGEKKPSESKEPSEVIQKTIEPPLPEANFDFLRVNISVLEQVIETLYENALRFDETDPRFNDNYYSRIQCGNLKKEDKEIVNDWALAFINAGEGGLDVEEILNSPLIDKLDFANAFALLATTFQLSVSYELEGDEQGGDQYASKAREILEDRLRQYMALHLEEVSQLDMNDLNLNNLFKPSKVLRFDLSRIPSAFIDELHEIKRKEENIERKEAFFNGIGKFLLYGTMGISAVVGGVVAASRLSNLIQGNGPLPPEPPPAPPPGTDDQLFPSYDWSQHQCVPIYPALPYPYLADDDAAALIARHQSKIANTEEERTQFLEEAYKKLSERRYAGKSDFPSPLEPYGIDSPTLPSSPESTTLQPDTGSQPASLPPQTGENRLPQNEFKQQTDFPPDLSPPSNLSASLSEQVTEQPDLQTQPSSPQLDRTNSSSNQESKQQLVLQPNLSASLSEQVTEQPDLQTQPSSPQLDRTNSSSNQESKQQPDQPNLSEGLSGQDVKQPDIQPQPSSTEADEANPDLSSLNLNGSFTNQALNPDTLFRPSPLPQPNLNTSLPEQKFKSQADSLVHSQSLPTNFDPVGQQQESPQEFTIANATNAISPKELAKPTGSPNVTSPELANQIGGKDKSPPLQGPSLSHADAPKGAKAPESDAPQPSVYSKVSSYMPDMSLPEEMSYFEAFRALFSPIPYIALIVDKKLYDIKATWFRLRTLLSHIRLDTFKIDVFTSLLKKEQITSNERPRVKAGLNIARKNDAFVLDRSTSWNKMKVPYLFPPRPTLKNFFDEKKFIQFADYSPIPMIEGDLMVPVELRHPKMQLSILLPLSALSKLHETNGNLGLRYGSLVFDVDFTMSEEGITLNERELDFLHDLQEKHYPQGTGRSSKSYFLTELRVRNEDNSYAKREQKILQLKTSSTDKENDLVIKHVSDRYEKKKEIYEQELASKRIYPSPLKPRKESKEKEKEVEKEVSGGENRMREAKEKEKEKGIEREEAKKNAKFERSVSKQLNTLRGILDKIPLMQLEIDKIPPDVLDEPTPENLKQMHAFCLKSKEKILSQVKLMEEFDAKKANKLLSYYKFFKGFENWLVTYQEIHFYQQIQTLSPEKIDPFIHKKQEWLQEIYNFIRFPTTIKVPIPNKTREEDTVKFNFKTFRTNKLSKLNCASFFMETDRAFKHAKIIDEVFKPEQILSEIIQSRNDEARGVIGIIMGNMKYQNYEQALRLLQV